MTITVSMKMVGDTELFKEGIAVEFTDNSVALTSDDLTNYFFRFCLACGYAIESVCESMELVIEEQLPPKITHMDEEFD